jgi:HK97 family phage major capsid protein
MSEFKQITTAVEQMGEAFEEFQKRYAAKLDWIETKLARPGAFTGTSPASSSGTGGGLIDTRTGKRLLEIRAGDDIAAKYRAAGLASNGERGEWGEFGELRLGDFVRAVAGQQTTELARKALSTGTDTAGGHMVPAVLMPGILEALVAGSSLMQAGSRLVPVGAPGDGAKSYTIAAINAVPQAAWRAEAGNVAESDPTFRVVVAVPRSLAFYFKVSRELLADAANLEEVLPTIIGQSMAREMDRAGLMGSGTAPEPRGIRNTAGVHAIGNGTNGASLGTVRWANLMSAAQAILNANGPMPTAAIMSPRSLIGFGSLADTTNQPLQRPQLLNPLRMVATSQVPVNLTVGSSNDCSEIYVGNFERTGYVMREAVSIQRLSELFATTGEVGFLCHARADFIMEYPQTMAVISGVRP